MLLTVILLVGSNDERVKRVWLFPSWWVFPATVPKRVDTCCCDWHWIIMCCRRRHWLHFLHSSFIFLLAWTVSCLTSWLCLAKLELHPGSVQWECFRFSVWMVLEVCSWQTYDDCKLFNRVSAISDPQSACWASFSLAVGVFRHREDFLMLAQWFTSNPICLRILVSYSGIPFLDGMTVVQF